LVSKNILVQYGDLQKEIKELRERIEKTEKVIAKIEDEGSVIDKVMGGAGGLQPFKIEGFPYPEYNKKKKLLQERKEILKTREIKLEEMLNQIDIYVSEVNDSRMRRIISLKYLDKMSWNQIAIRIGGNATADSVRMEFNRFLEK